MRTSAAGNDGLTLLELLVVVAIMALATAGIGLALRDASDAQLEREADRLAILLDAARAQSRLSGVPVRWHPAPAGFVFEGLSGAALPTHWLTPDVQAAPAAGVVLGPEPIIGAQRIRLWSPAQPGRSFSVATDGVRPFAVRAD